MRKSLVTQRVVKLLRLEKVGDSRNYTREELVKAMKIFINELIPGML